MNTDSNTTRQDKDHRSAPPVIDLGDKNSRRVGDESSEASPLSDPQFKTQLK